MEKKFKLIISPERCDAEALAHFIAELERLKLGVLTNGEMYFKERITDYESITFFINNLIKHYLMYEYHRL